MRESREETPAGSTAAAYAAALLNGHATERRGGSLGLRARATTPAAHDWASSGAMALTGPETGLPRLAPAPLAACMRAAVGALAELSGSAALAALDAPALLGERAAPLGLRRRGRISPGGSCRLLPTARGWLAINLARPDDFALLPAWLELAAPGDALLTDPWRAVKTRLRECSAEVLVERARLLGLAAAVAEKPPLRAPAWRTLTRRGSPRPAPGGAPRVVDLSSLWAGPLCTHLLQLAGAEVLKLESVARPDGARHGPADFYDLLNGGKPSVALDFRDHAELGALRRILESADIVVESARPRALAQLGIDAERWLQDRPGRTWLSLTGYGRDTNWIAYGDDAAVAAGLATASGSAERPLFCGDAIADPLTGAHAALAAWLAWREGGGSLLELSLRDVVAHALAFPDREPPATLRRAGAELRVVVAGREQSVRPPRARRPRLRARPLGADTQAVLALLPPAC